MLGKLDSHMQINETGIHLHTIHKINSNLLKDLNIRPETIKFREENIGKTFSDISLTNFFLGQSPKATEIRANINQWDLIKLTNFCTAKKTFKTNKQKKTTYRVNENSFK